MAIAELEGLPYLLVMSSITVLLAAVKICSVVPCVLLLFHIRSCFSAFGLQFFRTQTKLICKLQLKKKKMGQKERKGTPKGCKIVQREPCDACCFQSAACQLEAQRESERKRRDNAEK